MICVSVCVYRHTKTLTYILVTAQEKDWMRRNLTVMVIFGGQGIVGMRDFYFKRSMPTDAFIYKIPKYNGIQFHSGAYAKYCLINPWIRPFAFCWNGWPWDQTLEPPMEHLLNTFNPLHEPSHFCSFHRTNLCGILFLHNIETKIVFGIYEGIFKRNRANAVETGHNNSLCLSDT